MASFDFSFGDIPFCLDTDVVKQWIGKSIPFDDIRITTPERPYPAGLNLLGVAQPLRQPQRPNLKLGEFYYPASGATRWSELHVLITEKEYQQMVPAAFPAAITVVTSSASSSSASIGSSTIAGGPTPLKLNMQQDDAIVETSMYLLPPRVLAKFGENPGLYLASFVDERYFWQWKAMDFPYQGNWRSYIRKLTDDLDIKLTYQSNVEAVYADVSFQSDLYARYENDAILLDACLWNIGRILVRKLDGTYLAQRPTEALAAAQQQQPDYQLAGGDFNAIALEDGSDNIVLGAILPESVTITYPLRLTTDGSFVGADTTDHVPYNKTIGALQPYTISIADAGFEEYVGIPNTSKVFHDTAPAWVDNPTQTTPDNDANLYNLSLRLAEDFYNNQASGLDITFPSIFPWKPEGLHDITWCWMGDNCYTRVQRKPYNWQVEEFNHYIDHGISSSSAVSGSCSGITSQLQRWKPSCISGSLALFVSDETYVCGDLMGVTDYVLDHYEGCCGCSSGSSSSGSGSSGSSGSGSSGISSTSGASSLSASSGTSSSLGSSSGTSVSSGSLPSTGSSSSSCYFSSCVQYTDDWVCDGSVVNKFLKVTPQGWVICLSDCVTCTAPIQCLRYVSDVTCNGPVYKYLKFDPAGFYICSDGDCNSCGPKVLCVDVVYDVKCDGDTLVVYKHGLQWSGQGFIVCDSCGVSASSLSSSSSGSASSTACAACTTGYPYSWQLTLSGFTGNCFSNFDGTYVLVPNSADGIPCHKDNQGICSCEWFYEQDDGNTDLRIVFDVFDPSESGGRCEAFLAITYVDFTVPFPGAQSGIFFCAGNNCGLPNNTPFNCTCCLPITLATGTDDTGGTFQYCYGFAPPLGTWPATVTLSPNFDGSCA